VAVRQIAQIALVCAPQLVIAWLSPGGQQTYPPAVRGRFESYDRRH
jgi:hypothetical protein